jgi:GMP synthase-like glutamine amidotransferase
VLGTSWRGPQCIVDDAWGARVIGWQFHPEVTPATYERWVAEGYYGDTGDDPKELVRQAHANAARTRNLAHALTDSALRYLGVAAGREA